MQNDNLLEAIRNGSCDAVLAIIAMSMRSFNPRLNTFVMSIIRSVMQKDNLGVVLQYVSYGGALAIIAMSLYSFNPINDQFF